LLDPECIGLHLSQVSWWLDPIRVHDLALPARAGPPSRNGTLVAPQRRYDGLDGASMGAQGHHEHHGLCRGAQPREASPRAGAAGFGTRVAEEALLLLRMETKIALAGLASGRAVRMGAQCGCGVHDPPPWLCVDTLPRGGCLDLRFLYNFTAPRFGAELPKNATGPAHLY
jgi:hypothetical protein